MKCFFISFLFLFPIGLFAAESTLDTDTDGAARIRQVEARTANVGGIDIAYKVLGQTTDPTVMLITGLGASHLFWGDRLPYGLVDAGFQVIIFDNRDVGDSQHFDEQGDEIMWWEFLKYKFGFEVNAAYDLGDMASDSVGLLDELSVERAHIVGASMGGMIAQVLAARYPDRVSTLTSIMSSPGFGDHLPSPTGPHPSNIMDPAADESEEQRMSRLRRIGLYPESMPRQFMAILKSGNRAEEVKTITAPTLVLHGKDDTLIPLRHGEYTAELIPRSKFVAFSGMGHNLRQGHPPAMPLEVILDIVSNMVAHMSASSDINK